MKKLLLVLLSSAVALFGQANRGELQLLITDPSGAPVGTSIRLVSEANQYAVTLSSGDDGRLTALHLPYGLYRIEIHQPTFDSVSRPIEIVSSIPTRATVQLKVASVEQS